MKVTVLTPAYNRANLLSNLYESLLKQTSQDFEWLIIDDGSMDNTSDIIKNYIQENKIKIRYIWQENGGKHRALNNGISNIESQITFIVDSDDYLLEDAIESIVKYYEKYKNDSNICGLSFLRCYPNMEINGDRFKKDEFISDYISCRLNGRIRGDKAEAYITKYLKEIPFLEIENEKFLFEDYVWIRLALKYNTVHINKPIYVGEYLQDGLTKNITKLKVISPIGMMRRAQVMCNPKCNFFNRMKGMTLYLTYGKIAQISNKELYKDINDKLLFLLARPLSYVMLKKIRKELECE